RVEDFLNRRSIFMKRITSLLLSLTLTAIAPIAGPAQTGADTDINAKIRQEEAGHSQIMRTMHYLTDIFGPRLTGSPNHKAAAEWAVKQMKEWGFENTHLEPWDFGHPGWLNERLSAHIISPVKDELSCKALAWTPSTNGTVTGPAVQLIQPEKPTQTEMDAY